MLICWWCVCKGARAHSLGELHFGVCDASGRVHHDQQVQWGISRSQILRRKRVCGINFCVFCFEPFILESDLEIRSSGTSTWQKPCVKSALWKLFGWIPKNGEVNSILCHVLSFLCSFLHNQRQTYAKIVCLHVSLRWHVITFKWFASLFFLIVYKLF